MKVLAHMVREHAPQVPVIVRTLDDTDLERAAARPAPPRWCPRPSRAR